jgi:hypothetical protein
MPAAKAQAGSAFTSLVNSFFVSLVALSRAWSLVQGRHLAAQPAGGK